MKKEKKSIKPGDGFKEFSEQDLEKMKKIPPTVKEGSVVEKKKHFGLSWFNKRKLKKKPDISFLIKMHFSNGTSKEFVVSTKEETFDYMKRTYYLRYENSWFEFH